MSSHVIGVDVGGAFTDLIVVGAEGGEPRATEERRKAA